MSGFLSVSVQDFLYRWQSGLRKKVKEIPVTEAGIKSSPTFVGEIFYMGENVYGQLQQ